MEISDLAGIKEPLAKLVESVADAIGAVYEPTRVRRKAEADADAMLILAGAEIEAGELRRRADARAARTELRRQRNVERIVAQAAKELPESVDGKSADADWIAQFFNLSQDVGDAEMQTLWARLLAGEVARPGTYSLRTLHTVRVLSKSDAQLFTQYCAYVWLPGGGSLCRYTTEATDKFLADRGIGIAEREHLQNLGLMAVSGLMTGSGSRTAINPHDLPLEVTYFGRKFLIRNLLEEDESALVFPEFLTDVGIQLFPVSGARPDERYLETLIQALAAEDKLEVSPLD